MFSSDIVKSDAFLEMSPSTQALYFHLGMHADDDGFVNPRMIMRMIGSTDDELKVLVAKRFLLTFESGVVVVKHWLIHNLIRADLYKETQYKKEKSTLGLNENGAYTELKTGRKNVYELKKIEPPKWLKIRRKTAYRKRAVYGSETVLRLGKDRLGKDSINIQEIVPSELFDFESYLKDMIDPSKQKSRHIRIIGYYLKAKGLTFKSKAEVSAVIKRHSRAAAEVAKFEDKEKINKAFRVCQEMEVKNPQMRWTLESVLKVLTK